MGFTYKSYNFVDKDPMIDEIRTIVEQSGATYKWVHGESGVGANTIAKWFDGSTRRPQAATMNAVLRSLGYKLGVVEFAKVIVPDEGRRPTAAPINTRHIVQMAKFRGGTMTMAVRFKVGFTMSAETLFGIIAKVLPIEDLQVEEIEPRKAPVAKVARLVRPENRPLKRNRHSGVSLEQGANGVIMRLLADGPQRYRDLKTRVAGEGYAATGIGAKLKRLREIGAVERVSPGLWRMAEAKKTA